MTSLSNTPGMRTKPVSRDGWRIVRLPPMYGTILTAIFPIIMMICSSSCRCVRVSNSPSGSSSGILLCTGSFVAALGKGLRWGTSLQEFRSIRRVTLSVQRGIGWNWKSILVALTLIQGYVLIGSTYLILKHQRVARNPIIGLLNQSQR